MTAEYAGTAEVPILADLIFWTVTAGVVLAASNRLAADWGSPRAALVTIAALVLAAGLAGLAWRNRLRGVQVALVFGWANLAIAPVLLLLAVLDLLDLTRSGDVALGVGAAVAAAFGLWQRQAAVTSRRRS